MILSLNGKSCSWIDIKYCITQFCKRFCENDTHPVIFARGQYYPRLGHLFQLDVTASDLTCELSKFKNGYILHANGKWEKANKLSGYWCADSNVDQFHVVELNSDDLPISVYWGERGINTNIMLQWKIGENRWIESRFLITEHDLLLQSQMIVTEPNLPIPVTKEDKQENKNTLFFW